MPVHEAVERTKGAEDSLFGHVRSNEGEPNPLLDRTLRLTGGPCCAETLAIFSAMPLAVPMTHATYPSTCPSEGLAFDRQTLATARKR